MLKKMTKWFMVPVVALTAIACTPGIAGATELDSASPVNLPELRAVLDGMGGTPFANKLRAVLDELDNGYGSNKANIENLSDSVIDNTVNIATNATNIENNATNIANNTAKIAQNKADIAENRAKIAQNKADIAENRADIAQNKANIAENRADIAQNKANIAENRADIAQNKANIAENRANIAQNKADIAENRANIAQNREAIKAEVAERKAEDMRLDRRIDSLNDRVDALDTRLNKGIAMAAAIANISPPAFDKEHKATASVAVSNFKGENAFAGALMYQPDAHVNLSLAFATCGGETVSTLSASFRL